MVGSSTTARNIWNSGEALGIGTNSIATGLYLDGWLDETRITKGVARYASDGIIVPITWDPTTILNATLSGGNLIVTNTGTTATNQGVSGPSAFAKSNAGKFYFEVSATTITGGSGVGIGVGPTGTTITAMSTAPPVNAYMVYIGNTGKIWGNGTGNTGLQLGTFANGDVLCVAMDCGNGRVWFRLNNGLWDNVSGHDPTIGDGTHGGQAFAAATSMIPFATFGNGPLGSGGASGNVFTANFGASAFSYPAPSGYVLGWPQQINAAFTVPTAAFPRVQC
jgi:hypothetical protein